MSAADESSDDDASEQLSASWLRRAITGPQPSTLPAEAAAAPRAVPRATTGARPRASGPAARRKNAEDVRALLGETTMHRILPSTGSGPPSPVLLRRAATVVGSRATGKKKSPGWRWPDFFERPSPPPRRAARAPAGDDCDEEDEFRRPLLCAWDAHTTRAAGETETETETDESRALRAVAALRRLAGVPPDFPSSEKRPFFSRVFRKANTLPVTALLLGCAVPVARAALLASKQHTSFIDEWTPKSKGLSLAFEWCAFAAGWRALRAASSARDASFLEDPDALDALSLRARAAQVDLLRRRTFPELTLFLVPFAAARVASAARDAARAVLGDAGASSAVFSSVASFAAAVSETYQAAVFFAACASFRLACGMALFRLNAFLTRFEDWGRPARAAETGDASPFARRGSLSTGEFSPESLNDVAAQASEDSVQSEVFVVVAEHDRLRTFLKRVGKRFRLFLLVTLTSAFAEIALAALGAARSDRLQRPGAAAPRRAASVFLEACLDPRTLGTVARVSCVALNVRAAALVTHRLQRVAGFASRRHAEITAAETRPGAEHRAAAAFRARDAALGVFRDQPLRVSVYGFAWDREFFRGLHMVVFATALFVVTRALV
jgi:hypothetical protein